MIVQPLQMEVEVDGQIIKRSVSHTEPGLFGAGIRLVPETRPGEEVFYYLGRGIPTIIRTSYAD